MVLVFFSINQLSQAEGLLDTAQIEARLLQCKQLEDTDFDAAIVCAQEMLEAAKHIQFKSGEASANLRLGYIYLTKGDFQAAIPALYKSYTLRMEIGQISKAVGPACLISYAEEQIGHKDSAFSILYACLRLIDKNDSSSLAKLHMNLGNLHASYKETTKAIEFIKKAEAVYIDLMDSINLGLTWSSLGNVYFQQKKFQNALNYYLQADAAISSGKDHFSLARNQNNIALCYDELGSPNIALSYYFRAQKAYIDLEMNYEHTMILSNIGLAFKHAKKLDSALVYFKGSLQGAEVYGYPQLQLTNLDFISETYSDMGKYDSAYAFRKKHSVLNDSLSSLEKVRLIAEMQTKYEMDKKEQQIQLLDAKNTVSAGQRDLFISASILGLLLAITLLVAWSRTSKEKKRSDDLLLNILPEEVAEELKATGTNQAKLYQHVTVLFTDFVGFTKISQSMSPQELVQEIHKHFTAFDLIMEKHGLEKIKTIGDAYMAVCGLPTENEQHAQKTIDAALDIIAYLESHKDSFHIRIGINSGPVVAGIVGVKKFAYDIWGDTVNMAARMEQNSEPNRVNISQETYDLIKNEYSCTYRGMVEAKNKGEIVMYFVENKKQYNSDF